MFSRNVRESEMRSRGALRGGCMRVPEGLSGEQWRACLW